MKTHILLSGDKLVRGDRTIKVLSPNTAGVERQVAKGILVRYIWYRDALPGLLRNGWKIVRRTCAPAF